MNIAKIFLIICVCFCLTNLTVAQSKKKQKNIASVIEKGKSYLGTPYKWGGNSKKGIDCSGLTQNCYKSIGIDLPRTAKAQSKIGNKKSWNEIRAGDIVYFKFESKGKIRYHIGIITSVSDKKIMFLHSSSRGVVESNLLDDYYKKNVKVFRRVI